MSRKNDPIVQNALEILDKAIQIESIAEETIYYISLYKHIQAKISCGNDLKKLLEINEGDKDLLTFAATDALEIAEYHDKAKDLLTFMEN